MIKLSFAKKRLRLFKGLLLLILEKYTRLCLFKGLRLLERYEYTLPHTSWFFFENTRGIVSTYKGKTYLIFPYLYISMVRLRACCAASVMASASSRITILWRPLGRVTFCCANILIRFRTTSIPLSLEAFNSKTASLNEEPSKCLARHKIVVVFPTPIEKMNFHENVSKYAHAVSLYKKHLYKKQLVRFLKNKKR